MSQIGEPVKTHEIEPLQEPVPVEPDPVTQPDEPIPSK